MKTKSNTIKHIFAIFVVIVISLTAFCFLLLNLYAINYYHTDSAAEASWKSDAEITVINERNFLFFDSKGTDTALIFYPGAKVEYTAYAPLIRMLAENGIDCFLMKMPYNLAIFGVNEAKQVFKEHRYSSWYIMGHSLGGAMASFYAEKNADDLDGLVFLASYPAVSLKNCDFKVLSIYGSEDGVLNIEKLEKWKKDMPEDFTEMVIIGGNHAGFGAYGMQKGDQKALITREEQCQQTAKAIISFIKQ